MSTLSIIVPCYNCEKIISGLIDSLKNQTCQDFEVVFVEDCSKDETLEQIKKLLQDSCLKYQLHQNSENKGPGYTRNAGVKYSDGEYILFADSDDRFEQTAVEKLLTVINDFNKPDAVLFDYFSSRKGKTTPQSTVVKGEEGWLTREAAILYSTSATWCKMYKAEVVRKNQIFFPDIRAKEDFVFNKAALSYCKDVFYLKENLYYYEYNASSIMNTIKLIGEANAKNAFSALQSMCSSDCTATIRLLSIQEYLYGSLQSMVRMKCTINEMNEALGRYQRNYSGWKTDYKKLMLSRAVKMALFFIEHKLWTLFICEVRMKDFLKNIYVK